MTATMRLRAAGRDDDAAIRAVIGSAFDDNPKTDAAVTAWQYWDNPFGPTRAWVWEDEDRSSGSRVVACYVAFALPMILAGQVGLGSSGVDAAMHPDYQGRRLFRPMAEALYADAGAHGLAVTLCFATNPAALKGIAAAGWVGVDELRPWVRPVDHRWVASRFSVPAPLARAGTRIAFGRSKSAAGAEETSRVPGGLDGLWAATEPFVDNGVARGAEWWQWRYGARPVQDGGPRYRYFTVHRAGALAGAAVTVQRDAFGGTFSYVLEFMAIDDEAGGALGGVLARAAAAEGSVGLALLALPGDRLEHLARTAGFRRLPRRLVPRPTWYGAVPNVPSAPDPARTRWSFSWGDLDHL